MSIKAEEIKRETFCVGVFFPFSRGLIGQGMASFSDIQQYLDLSGDA